MNHAKNYVVIAVADGDGESAYGKRVWSERFTTEAAANAAHAFLAKAADIRVTMIEDDRPILDVCKIEG